MASGGLRLARRWTELLDLMEDAVAHPARDRALRARMVEDECGEVDGRAAERVACALARLATEASACRTTQPATPQHAVSHA